MLGPTDGGQKAGRSGGGRLAGRHLNAPDLFLNGRLRVIRTQQQSRRLFLLLFRLGSAAAAGDRRRHRLFRRLQRVRQVERPVPREQMIPLLHHLEMGRLGGRTGPARRGGAVAALAERPLVADGGRLGAAETGVADVDGAGAGGPARRGDGVVLAVRDRLLLVHLLVVVAATAAGGGHDGRQVVGHLAKVQEVDNLVQARNLANANRCTFLNMNCIKIEAYTIYIT
jgi:hypothetical protein